MNKTELIAAVANEAEITKKDAEKAVKAVFSVISDSLTKGDKVQIIGFGTFEVRQRKAREGRNPRTGQTVKVPAKYVPYFRAGKEIREQLNGPRAQEEPAAAS